MLLRERLCLLTCSFLGCASAHVQAALLQQQAAHSEASPQIDSPLPWPSLTACKAFALGLLPRISRGQSSRLLHAFGTKGK